MAEANLTLLLKTVADTYGAEKTEAALRKVGQQAQTTSSLTQGLAREVANLAAGYFTLQAAAQLVSNVFTSSLTAARDNERVTRALAAAYGSQSKEFERFAAGLSSTTGFTSQAIMEAALAARTLSSNYELTTEQTKQLITVSADLARTRGIGVAEAFGRVESAIRGEAEAAEYVGVTLNATYLANVALGGSLKRTFETMSEGEKSQVRLNELLRQTADFAGLAAIRTDTLDGAMTRTENSINKVNLALGNMLKGPTIAGLNGLADFFEDVRKTIQEPDLNSQRFGAFLGEVFKGTRLDEAMRIAQARKEELEVVQQIAQAQTALDADARIRNEPGAAGSRMPGAGDIYPARLAALDQRQAAVRDLLAMQREEEGIQTELNRLHDEEAQALLRVLPVRQQIVQLERELTDAVDRRVQLALEAQRISAEQRAAPVSQALEDTENAIERNRLLLGIRGLPSEQRSAARRAIRDLTRNVAPGQRLAAFDAQGPITAATRAQGAFDLATRAAQLPIEGRLAEARAGARPGEDALVAVQQSIERQENLANIAAARTDAQQQVLGQIIQQAITDGFIKRPPTQVQIQVLTPEGTVSYQEIVEAADQAEMPPVVRVSGVRR